MRTSFLSILLLITFSTISGQNEWTQRVDFGGCERAFGFSFVINNKAYVGGGEAYGCGTGYDNEMWEYDPELNFWTQKTNVPINSLDIKAFSIGDYGYIISVCNSSKTLETQVWQYNPSTDSWSRKINFPGENRNSGIAISTDAKGYYGLGYSSYSGFIKNDFWEYDPMVDVWVQKCDMSIGRQASVAFSTSSRVFVGLGFTEELMNDFWEYNPSSDQWIRMADFSGTKRQFAVGFCIGDKGYIGTGYDETFNYTNDFWQYDVVTNTWQQIADLPGYVRQAATSFTINDNGFVTNGYDGTPYVTGYKDLWSYSPSTSLVENKGSSSVNIYPNPTVGEFNINFNKNKFSKIRLINSFGEVIFESCNIYNEPATFKLTGYPKGIYLVELSGTHYFEHKKLVLE